MICLPEVSPVVFPEYNPNIDQLACVLREHRSPVSLVILPLLLAAAVAFRPGTFTELGAACTSPTLSSTLLIMLRHCPCCLCRCF